MNEEILKKLYDNASSEFDMPSYEQFVLDMQDETKLESFRNSISEVFEVPDLEQFKSDLGFSKKKEDTESPSEVGSLDSQDSEFVKKFKSTGLATISNVARIPAFVQEQIVTLATAFDPEAREALNKMSFEERERALGMFANISGQAIAGTQLRDFSNELQTRSNEIAETFKQYDQSITDDILDLELGQATARIFAEIGGAIPSIIQAFVPVVGLTSIGLGSAAAESRELQQEGEDLGLKTSATAALYGTAEAALETVTRGIGKRFFKSLAGKGDEFIKTSIKEFVKRTSKDFAAEGSSELGTELLQNLTDYAIQGDEEAFNKELSHYTDIFIIGGFATAPISGATQGVQVTRQTLEKRALDRKLETTKYDDLVSMFQDPTIDQDTESLAVDQTKKFLKFDLDQKLEQGELTRTEADQALKNYEDAVYIKNEFKGVEIPQENRPAVAALFLEKRDLKNKISGKDPVLVSKEIERFQQIDGEIKTLLEPAVTTEEAATTEETSEVAPEPVVTQPEPQRVSEVLNRPVTLTKLGGSNLDAPIEGDLYVEGQQVVLEDENGNLTEIGNVDEISESSLEELGIEIAEPNVKPMSDGNLMFQDRVLISDKKGIKKNKRGEISRVTLREQGGAFVTLRGANAEEAAYQILLKEATSPEQAEFINQQLEQDEEFQNELRKATGPIQAETTADTQQATKQQYVQELKQIKESNPEQYWTVSEVSEDVADKGTLIDDKDGSALVKEDGDIIGVYKKPSSNAKGVAQKLLQKAVEAGGRKLDNFDNYLTPIYKKAGFRVVGRVAFNEEFAPDGWKPEFGKPDVVAMVYDPNNELNIEERTFEDYDKMIEYRDSFLELDPVVESEVQKLSQILKAPDLNVQVSNALRSLSRIAPDVNFVVYENEQDYEKATGNKASGSYDPNSRVISINASKANPRTVAHETFHAILTNLVKTDAEAKALTERMIKAVSRNASFELRRYLDEFAADYDNNIQSEEKLAELVGKLASEYDSLPTNTQSTIKKWLDRIAKFVGIKPFTDAEVIDVLNTISGKIAEGDEIAFEDVDVLGDPNTIGEKMSKRFQANFTDKVSGLTFMYDTNTERFKSLEEQGFITKDRKLSDFNGDVILLHQPDAAFSGTIMKNDEVLVEGKGGVFYPIKFHEDGYFWASTSRTAKGMADALNKVYEQNNGRILMALTSAPYDKLLSSTTMSNAVLDFFTSKALDRKFKVKKDDIKNAIIEAANKTVEVNDRTTGLGLSLKKGETLESITSKIKEKLSTENSAFADRKMFSESLISNAAKIINNNELSIKQFGELFSKGIQNKYFKGITKTGKVKISTANMVQAISEMFTEPMLKEGVERKTGGQVYAILEMNGMVQPIDSDKHESYPKAIQSIDGQKTVVHILKDRLNWNEVFEDFQTGEIVSKEREMNVYPTSGVSVQGLRLKVREQVSSVRSIVRTAKNNGISDAAILKYLRDNGLDVNEGFQILDRINQEEMRAKQQVEGLFDPNKNKVLNFIESVHKKFMSGRGFRPKSMQSLSDYREGSIEEQVQIARRNVKRIEKAIKSQKDPKKVIESIDKFMRGEQNHELPSSMIGIVSDMRRHLDNLSKMLAESGVVSDTKFDDLSKSEQASIIKRYGGDEKLARENYRSSKQNILENLGSYLNRSYEVYDNKNYAKKVSEEVKQAAKNKLRDIYREYAEIESLNTGVPVEVILNRKVDRSIDEILNQDEANEFIMKSKVGSKNLTPLEQRKEIPAEIRALMGEYGDPAMNYVRSIQKVASIIANQNFQKELRKAGEGVYLFTEPQGKYNTKIAGESSESMDILAGMYTTKEIAEAMTNGNLVNINLGQFQPIYDFYLKAVGSVKYTKTILSLGTHAKNIIGNIPFMVMTGNVNFKALNQSIQTIRAEYSKKGNPELLSKMDEYTRLGIINQSATLNEIKDLLSSGKTFEDVMIDKFSESGYDRVKRRTKGFLRFAEKAYQVEDDFFKIAAYESEKSKYAKALFNKNVDQLSESELKEVSERAADIVKNVLPNYSRVGGYVKLLKALPVAGTFISFTSESVRTSYNTIDQTIKEIADPKTRSIGIQRLGGIMSLAALKAGILALWGMNSDDEEEEESLKNVRKFLPFWDTYSTIVPTEIKDGKFKYRSISASDPHGYITKVFNAYMNADSYDEGLIRAIEEASQPWVNPDMTFSVVSELLSNRDKNGRAIFKEGDTSLEKAQKITEKLFKLYMPGTITSAIKIAKSENPGNEAIGQFTGFKEHSIDVLETLGYKSNDIQKRAVESASDYARAKRQYQRGEITVEELSSQYNISNDKKKAVYREAIDYYNGAVYLGVDPREVEQRMMDWGIPRYVVEGIQQGTIPDMNE